MALAVSLEEGGKDKTIIATLTAGRNDTVLLDQFLAQVEAPRACQPRARADVLASPHMPCLESLLLRTASSLGVRQLAVTFA